MAELFKIEDSISPRKQWEINNDIHTKFSSLVNPDIQWLAVQGVIDEYKFYNNHSKDAGLGATRQDAINNLVKNLKLRSFEETQLKGDQ